MSKNRSDLGQGGLRQRLENPGRGCSRTQKNYRKNAGKKAGRRF